MLDLDETFYKAFQGYFEDHDTISSSIKNVPLLQNSRKRLGGYTESWRASWCWILMKVSAKLPWDILNTLTPSPASPRTSLSSKTPWKDLEDRWSLDKLPDVRFWWNFQYSFPGIILVPWHHQQLNQECPCPARLQEETCRIGEVLTMFLMSNLDESFSKAF